MGLLRKLINKYNIYRPKYFPYDIGLMQTYAQSQRKAIHELSEQEVSMFLRENYKMSKAGKIIRKYSLPDAPQPNLEKLKEEADETAVRILERREQEQVIKEIKNHHDL